MDERELADSIRRVRTGALDRRQFARTLLGLGLTAPMVVELLGPRPGHTQPKRPVFTPSRRGGGGELKTLWWQAPTILNPHLATGAKDADASRIFYKSPNPFWAKAFSSIIPRHVFAPFKGARSREAPANLKPVGTGPYRYTDFKPGDLVRAEVFPGYHEANWPFFDRLEMKGGGDAVSAARAVIQTGEYDFAWNMQVEDDVLRRMEQQGG